jgi:hypothetical protein
VADVKATARRLVAVCGLDWDPACPEFHRNRQQVHTSSHTQVRDPVYRISVGRWKTYEPRAVELFAALAGNAQ